MVDGAILTCTNCTIEDKYIGSKDSIVEYGYFAPTDESIDRDGLLNVENKALGRLKVTENPKAEANSLRYATIKDCVQEKNIPYFGNCQRGPDSKTEMDIFDAIHKEENQGLEKRKAGSCKYLMKLESEWENYEIGQSFLAFDDDEKGRQTGITMTSMLFCKHGGFIYPVTSGQIISEQESVEENGALAIKILEKYLCEGDFEEEKVEWALNYLAEQSGYTLVSYNSRKGYDYDKYDNYILGWIKYYADTMGVMMDPKYIKSQVYEETGMGYTTSQKDIPVANSDTDVMQALDIRNGNIYEYIGISLKNFSAITSAGDYQTGSWFWKVNHSQNNESEPLADSYNKEKKKRCGGIIESLFNTEKDGSGVSYTEGSKEKYYFLDENVTPIMSIGMGLDIMQRAESSDDPIQIND